MLDRPDAATLLQAMAATLSDEVLPQTSGGTRHAVRVVANLCRILEREVIAGPAVSERSRLALAELLDREGTLPELVAELDRVLRNGETTDGRVDDSTREEGFESRVRRILLADVERRLSIGRPGYAS